MKRLMKFIFFLLLLTLTMVMCSCTKPIVPTPSGNVKEPLSYEDLTGTWELQNTYTFEETHQKGETVLVNYSTGLFYIQLQKDSYGYGTGPTQNIRWNEDSTEVSWYSISFIYEHYYRLGKNYFIDSCISTSFDSTGMKYYDYVARYAKRKEY